MVERAVAAIVEKVEVRVIIAKESTCDSMILFY